MIAPIVIGMLIEVGALGLRQHRATAPSGSCCRINPRMRAADAAGDKRMRLLGFERVELEPGQSERVMLTADRRLLGRFDAPAGRWRIDAGTYEVALGRAADALDLTAQTTLEEALFGS